MARPKKTGLDYFPLDVDFFSDKKIKILKARYGTDGITIYMYLLCEIYKTNGYYLPWDEDYKYIIAGDLNLTDGLIEQVLKFLVERSLFDSKLFYSDTILTSPAIQRRFQSAVKERAKKTPLEIDRFWILKEEETEPYLKVTQNDDNSLNNNHFSWKNESISEEKSIKESKEKKSKVKNKKEKELQQSLTELFENHSFSLTLQEKVKEWLEYKSERKESYKPQGLKSLLTVIEKKANEYGEAAVIELITICMSSNWKGIIWDKMQKKLDHAPRQGATKFNNFQEREYNYSDIEQKIFQKQWREEKS